jgi:hypothetical protein
MNDAARIVLKDDTPKRNNYMIDISTMHGWHPYEIAKGLYSFFASLLLTRN